MSGTVQTLIATLAALFITLVGVVALNSETSPPRASYASQGQQAYTVVDGDTIRRNGTTYRLENIDTPETGSRAKSERERDLGEAAKRRLAVLLSSGELNVIPARKRNRQTGEDVIKLDRYGRTLVRVYVGGKDVGEILVGEGLARPYTGGKRQPW